MFIRCKHERPGGSLVSFSFKDRPDYREYHFKPTGAKGDDGKSTGPHVAEVSDEGDIATLLAIESAYEEFTPGVKVSPASSPEQAIKTVLPQPKRNAGILKALEVMTEQELRDWSGERFPNMKLDPAHNADQIRTYLKGLLSKG